MRELPFATGYADVLVSIHVLEHFYAWEAHALLTEWMRVLKPGGKIVLELPCMDKVLRGIQNSLNEGLLLSPTSSWFVFWGDPKYRDPAMVHKWGYTIKALKELLALVGFENIASMEPQYHFPARDMRMEAFKPLSTT